MKEVAPAVIKAKALSAVWTFPSILLSAFIIAWGAEAAQFLVSQGLALAILAWLQTMPEFAVEAVIAWEAGKDIDKIHLVSANFTGSIRLLVGLGWPMIYFVRSIARIRSGEGNALAPLELDEEHSVEVLALVPPVMYFFVILAKGSLGLIDSVVLISLYVIYLIALLRIPPVEMEKPEELPAVPRWVMKQPERSRKWYVLALFAGGGILLYFTAHPFLESMLALAISVGISQYVFVQWVAPFLSEFPEKVSAFNWARTGKKAPIAMMNMVSSNINQWTLLIGMCPVIFSISQGAFSAIEFDTHQRFEIALTMVQSILGFMFLADMRLRWYEAAGLFVLWFIQFIIPHLREEILVVYILWILVVAVQFLIHRKEFHAVRCFHAIVKDWKKPKAG
ncbi:MAG: hypothetical protein AB1546_07265 [bacterium]